MASAETSILIILLCPNSIEEARHSIFQITLPFRFSIILVAFDLEEFGSQGALVFLHDFLIPKVLKQLRSIFVLPASVTFSPISIQAYHSNID